ncbi:MAG: cobalt ECF transporter T component CbiQ [Candidatus Methanoperedens sp.]
MLEWLTGDPLNGIIITIAFFISVIIGRYLRMKKAAIDNKRKLVDPRIKILFLFILIISITLMKHWYLPTGITVICTIFALKSKTFQNFSRKMIFPVILAFFIFVTQGLTYGTNKINYGIIPVYSEGLDSGFLIFTRVIAAASLGILLLSNTPENEVTETMRWYRVPGTMLDISSLMSRYIKAFSTEARKMKWAQESRCGFSKRSGFSGKMHDVASITGALITRALVRAELVYRAMLSRGWKHDRSFVSHQPLDHNDLLMGFVFASGIMILLGIDRMV